MNNNTKYNKEIKYKLPTVVCVVDDHSIMEFVTQMKSVVHSTLSWASLSNFRLQALLAKNNRTQRVTAVDMHTRQNQQLVEQVEHIEHDVSLSPTR